MASLANSSKPRKPAALVLVQCSHSQAERAFDQQRIDPKAAKPENQKQNPEAVTTTANTDSPNLTQLPNINPVSPRSKPKEILIDDKYISKLDYHSFAFTYAVRDGGDAKSKKQSMADLKLRRLQELNTRLKEDLERPRVKVAEASQSLVTYCTQTRDYMVPSVWGQVDKKDDPYNPQASGGSEGCCIVM